eukprot:7184416-Pyramimonas_sp.AAC.1
MGHHLLGPLAAGLHERAGRSAVGARHRRRRRAGACEAVVLHPETLIRNLSALYNLVGMSDPVSVNSW